MSFHHSRPELTGHKGCPFSGNGEKKKTMTLQDVFDSINDTVNIKLFDEDGTLLAVYDGKNSIPEIYNSCLVVPGSLNCTGTSRKNWYEVTIQLMSSEEIIDRIKKDFRKLDILAIDNVPDCGDAATIKKIFDVEQSFKEDIALLKAKLGID